MCLLPSNEAVVVRLSELSLTKPAPEEGRGRQTRESAAPASRHPTEPGGERGREPEGSRPWLAPNIRSVWQRGNPTCACMLPGGGLEPAAGSR